MDERIKGWSIGWKKPDRRPIWEWAHENIILPDSYAIPGRFDALKSRYMLQPFADLQNDDVRSVTLTAGIQTGKTLICEVFIPWAIANDPGPIMWTMQTDEDAKEHCRQRFMEMLKTTAAVKKILPENRHDKTVTDIYFGPFFLTVNGANMNNLQRVSIRYKINSEVWLWKQGLLKHAEGRVRKFEEVGTSKILNEGQGGIFGDDHHNAWMAGNQCTWAAPCKECGKPHTIEFEIKDGETLRGGIVWDKDAKRADGSWDIARAAESARFRCPHCGAEAENSPRTRAWWNDNGLYLPRNPDAPRRRTSYRWTSIVSRDMGDIVQEWLEAVSLQKQGIDEGIKSFIQKTDARSWVPQEQVDTIHLTPTGYSLADYFDGQCIDGEIRRFITIDRQQNHFWVLARAWRSDGSSILLYAGKVETVENIRSIQQRLKVEDQLTFEDAQYDTSEVYKDCLRFGWTALHGSGESGFWHQIRGQQKPVRKFFSPINTASVGTGKIRYLFWSNEKVKDVLANLRDKKGARWEYAHDAIPEYLDSLNSETKKEILDSKTRRIVWRWVRVKKNNHLWDCEAMQTAAALMMRVLGNVVDESGKVDGPHPDANTPSAS